jgi:hypothetical protein
LRHYLKNVNLNKQINIFLKIKFKKNSQHTNAESQLALNNCSHIGSDDKDSANEEESNDGDDRGVLGEGGIFRMSEEATNSCCEGGDPKVGERDVRDVKRYSRVRKRKGEEKDINNPLLVASMVPSQRSLRQAHTLQNAHITRMLTE